MSVKLSRILQLRSKLKPYGTRPTYDVLKEVDKECAKYKIDNWLVRCTDQQFETVLKKDKFLNFKL